MRLCCINISVEQTSQAFLPVLHRVFDMARRPDTSVTIKCVDPGLVGVMDARHAYFRLLNEAHIVDKVLEAEAEGFDAAMVLCFLDPGVRTARELVKIPVIGLAEASLFLACQLGGKIAIIVLDDHKALVETEQQLARFGIDDRLTRNPIVPISIPTRELLRRGMYEPEWAAASVKEAAQRCVEDGAEVVVIGCAGLGPMATLGGLNKIEGIDVPIIDCVQAGLKMAELRVELAQRLGWPVVSRAGMYMMPRDKDVQRVRETFGLAVRAAT